MKIATYARLLQYLEDKLALPEDSIKTTFQNSHHDLSLLPIALWQNGLITVKQLEQVFDWLVSARADGRFVDSSRSDNLS
ncbi:MAG: DUF2949 domain-containing protein [Cyanobacteria bacterium J06554_11]